MAPDSRSEDIVDNQRLDDLQRHLKARSWLYDDPVSHAAGVEEAVTALRDLLADAGPRSVAARPGGDPPRVDRVG